MSDMSSILEFASDISDAEAPKALPAGDYVAEITGAEVGVSQNSGKPRVKVDFRIKPEDFPADYEDADSFADGKIVSYYVTVADDKATRFRLRRFCEAIGAPTGSKLDVNEWIGKQAVLTIEPDEYEGVERERAKKVEAK